VEGGGELRVRHRLCPGLLVQVDRALYLLPQRIQGALSLLQGRDRLGPAQRNWGLLLLGARGLQRLHDDL
jgi:hypothetical protein